jgi:apolipoprotein N-acyltransferase
MASAETSDSLPPANVPPPLRRARALAWWRLLLAGFGGLLLGLSFPTPGWSGLAWLGPGVLLLGALGLPAGAAFRYGWLAGLVQYLVALRWLLHIPFPAGAVAGWLALSAYCAVYPGLWIWLSLRVLRLHPEAPPAGPESPLGPLAALRESAARFTARPWLTRLSQLFWTAALWVALEMLLARFLTGFPWSLLGLSQWHNAPLIQLASVAGVYGVSFLLVWFSVSLGVAILGVAQRPTNRFGWTTDLRVPLFTLLVVVGLGFARIVKRTPTEPDRVSLALVQPSIPQQVIWDADANPARFDKVFQLSRQALATRPDVLLWPEGSLPDMTQEQLNAMTNLLAGTGAWWIFGSADAEPAPPEDGVKWRHFNAAFLLSPAGRLVESYHKRRLVIFGEYIPFERTLPFMKWLTPIGASFTPGPGPGVFRVGHGTNRTLNISPMICFEDVFPHHTRPHVNPETDFVLELTNNGWFGESGAQWQHAASAVFRAVENGVPLVRCTNNGLTCWLDEFGRMHDLFRSASGSVYEAGFLLTSVPLRPGGEPRELTWYHEHGDTFGWICVVLALGGVLRTVRWKNSAAVV